MNNSGYILNLTMVFAMSISLTALATAPSPEDLDKWEAYEQARDARLEQAKPWEAALRKALPSEAESTVHFLFLTTYKHQVQDSGQAAPKGQDAKAKAFARAWAGIRKSCSQARLHPHELAEALYRFTNSDWAPMSVTRGPGLDQVATPKALETWAKAAIEAGRKAQKAKLDPASVWRAQAESYDAPKPEDLKRVGLTPPPRRH